MLKIEIILLPDFRLCAPAQFVEVDVTLDMTIDSGVVAHIVQTNNLFSSLLLTPGWQHRKFCSATGYIYNQNFVG